MGSILSGFLASLLAGLMPAAGALPVLFGSSISKKLNDALLGFAAGVMLAASFFSLIIPGIEGAHDQFGGRVIPAAIAAIGVSLGVFCMAMLNERVPHEHLFQGRQGPQTTLARVWLFVLAITSTTYRKASRSVLVSVAETLPAR